MPRSEDHFSSSHHQCLPSDVRYSNGEISLGSMLSKIISCHIHTFLSDSEASPHVAVSETHSVFHSNMAAHHTAVQRTARGLRGVGGEGSVVGAYLVDSPLPNLYIVHEYTVDDLGLVTNGAMLTNHRTLHGCFISNL